MARPQTEIPEQNLKDAITDYRAGVLSIPEIARRHGIPVPVLRRRLKGIPQDGISTTRALVSGALAGIPNAEIDAKVSATVAKGAALATDAMVTADEVFRLALKRSKKALEDDEILLSPKELRDYTATAKDAMEGVRRVRELDGPKDNPLKDLFSQLGVSPSLRPAVDA